MHWPSRTGITFIWSSTLELVWVEFICICTWRGEVMERSRIFFYWYPEPAYDCSLLCFCTAKLLCYLFSGLCAILQICFPCSVSNCCKSETVLLNFWLELCNTSTDKEKILVIVQCFGLSSKNSYFQMNTCSYTYTHERVRCWFR